MQTPNKSLVLVIFGIAMILSLGIIILYTLPLPHIRLSVKHVKLDLCYLETDLSMFKLPRSFLLYFHFWFNFLEQFQTEVLEI